MLVLFVFVSLRARQAVLADVLTVCTLDCDHTTVQAAVTAAAAGDTIRIGPGVYRESIRIDKELTLEGQSAEETVFSGFASTVVHVGEDVTVSISDVTITNGVGDSGGTAQDGGGIFNQGTLTLTDTLVERNIAPENLSGRGKGGGIRNDGTLTIQFGAIQGNVATGRGGAIYNRGELMMHGVTVCGNSGGDGAAVFNERIMTLTSCALIENIARTDGGAVVTEDRCFLTNCTLSGNKAEDGGAIWIGGTRVPRSQTRLIHCTLTDNEVTGRGAGIFNDRNDAVEIDSTIIASNGGGAECLGAMLSLGYNLDSDDTCNLDPAGERPDHPGVNPHLSQLGHHGGPTLMHALPNGSLAVDGGGEGCSIVVDQRGLLRPVGGMCDVGAYERPGCGSMREVFTRGEANGDTVVNIADAVFLLLHLFGGEQLLCQDAGDSNDDGSVNVADPVFLLNWLFASGSPQPPPIFCDTDPTDDALGCMQAATCDEALPQADGGGLQGYQDLWTAAAELAEKPLSGAAWESVLAAGEDACAGEANITNQDSNNNVQILGAAIVYARTAAENPSFAARFRNKVVTALERLTAEGDPVATHGCPFGCGKAVNSTLAWGREIGAYVLAADLVRYRTSEFEEWLANMADTYVACDGRTMHEAFLRRPNNWGLMNFGSLVAVYAYLGDDGALGELRDRIVQGLTVGVPDCQDVEDGVPCYVWGGSVEPSEKDMTWHCDPANPRLISQPCTLSLPEGGTIDVDGLIPDDQRRACSFCPPGVNDGVCGVVFENDGCVQPREDAHITDWINGAVMGARILARIGMPIWDVGDRAFERMIIAHMVTHCQVTCDDGGFGCESLYNCKDWVLPILDPIYDIEATLSSMAAPQCLCPLSVSGRGVGASKNAGFGAYIAAE